MSKTIVHSAQSFFNKVVESTGSIDVAFETAMLNGMSITDSLTTGQELIKHTVANKQVVSFFSEKRPATGITTDQELALIPELGIGTMAIGSTFIVG